MKAKALIISLTAIGAVILFFGVFILSWFVGDVYADFKKFEKEFAIEGLDDGAVPQGITSYEMEYVASYDEETKKPINKRQQYFLISAYMNDGSPSRIYVTGKDTGYVGYVTMLNKDGSPHTGHVGGIATNGAMLWVTDNTKILCAQVSSAEEYKNKNILQEIIDKATRNRAGEEEFLTISFTAEFNANCRASFLYYADDSRSTSPTYDRLYVGEFYRKGNYETDTTHRLVTPNGYKNTAFLYEYNVDGYNSATNPYGLTRIQSLADGTVTENVPKIQKIYSLPEMIQGMAFSRKTGYGATDGVLVLSQSYGLANSHLLCFDWAKINETGNRKKYTETHDNKSFTYADVYLTSKDGSVKTPYTDNNLYVWYVDKNNSEIFVNDYSVPSMSEGMCTPTPYSSSSTDGIARVYVLFESGSKKYRLFTRESIKNVYSFIPNINKLQK